MKKEKIDINLLNSSEYNPRKDLQPEDIEYKKIKRSIEEFGYVDPLIINNDMNVIGGKGKKRLKRYKQLFRMQISENRFIVVSRTILDLKSSNNK